MLMQYNVNGRAKNLTWDVWSEAEWITSLVYLDTQCAIVNSIVNDHAVQHDNVFIAFSHRLKSIPMNRLRFTELGLPYCSPIKVITKGNGFISLYQVEHRLYDEDLSSHLQICFVWSLSGICSRTNHDHNVYCSICEARWAACFLPSSFLLRSPNSQVHGRCSLLGMGELAAYVTSCHSLSSSMQNYRQDWPHLDADWLASWHISTKSYQWQWKCGCSFTSSPGHPHRVMSRAVSVCSYIVLFIFECYHILFSDVSWH